MTAEDASTVIVARSLLVSLPSAGEDMLTEGAGSAVENLVEVHVRARTLDFAIVIARQFLADEVGIEQRLVDLTDGRDVNAANDPHELVEVA